MPVEPEVSGPPDTLPALLAETTLRLASAVDRRRDPHDEQRLLERLTETAVATVPGAACAGLTMNTGRGLISRAPSHPRIADLDRLQVELGEGPCVDVVGPGRSHRVSVLDLAVEPRWPRFAAAAVERGVRCLLSYVVTPHGRPSAAMNLYGTRPDALGAVGRAVAGVFATHVAVLLHGAEAVADLVPGPHARDMIGQATGILVERYRLDDDAAFDLLVRYSRQTNAELHDAARLLVGVAVARTDAHGA